MTKKRLENLMVLSVLVPLVLVPDARAADAKAGEALFTSRACVGCHSIGGAGSAATGPNLLGVTQRRTPEWLARWLQNPDAMRTDTEVVKLHDQYKMDMPNLGLSADEVQSLILYLKSKDLGR